MTEAETRIPWREALKRAGSFDALRPHLHMGRIPARHGGLFSLSDGKVHSEPGDFKPEQWAVVHTDRAGRVIFITEEVVFGGVVQEVVFANASSIELDSVAFDTFFPAATVPKEPHEHDPGEPAKHAGGRPPLYLWPEWKQALDAWLKDHPRPKEIERLVEWSQEWFEANDAGVSKLSRYPTQS